MAGRGSCVLNALGTFSALPKGTVVELPLLWGVSRVLLASETDGDGISGLVDPLCVVQRSDRGLPFSITRSQHKIQDTLGLLPSPGSPTEETKARAPF